jgi:hypothetical protein
VGHCVMTFEYRRLLQKAHIRRGAGECRADAI